MKKFLAILLLLSMLLTAFVACDNGEVEETTPNTDAAEEAATLADAVEYLNSMYKSDEGKKTPADYLLIAQVPIGDVKFEITWTVDSTEVTISEPANSMVTIDINEEPAEAVTFVLTATLKDAEGNVVGTATTEASDHAHVLIDVKNPHLWNGMADPYLYTAEASIISGEEVLDTVTVTYGYRSFHVDANTGFYLNGKSVPLHGVSRHQDRLDKGWAISKADHEEDVALIKELGANNLSESVGEAEKATHGEEASWETIINLNPEYIFVLDRSSATGGVQVLDTMLSDLEAALLG